MFRGVPGMDRTREFVDMRRYTADYVGVPYGLTKHPVVIVKAPA